MMLVTANMRRHRQSASLSAKVVAVGRSGYYQLAAPQQYDYERSSDQCHLMP